MGVIIAGLFGLAVWISSKESQTASLAARPIVDRRETVNGRIRELLDQDAAAQTAAALERAGMANEAAEGAKKEANQASVEQQRLRESNLQLQQTVEEERTARLTIERRLAQRGLTRNELISVTMAAGSLGGQAIDIVFPKDDAECRLLATNLMIAFPEPAWKPTLYEGPGWWMHQVDVEYDPQDLNATKRAEAIFNALHATKKLNMGGPFYTLPHDVQGTSTNYYSSPPRATLRITIGYR